MLKDRLKKYSQKAGLSSLAQHKLLPAARAIAAFTFDAALKYDAAEHCIHLFAPKLPVALAPLGVHPAYHVCQEAASKQPPMISLQYDLVLRRFHPNHQILQSC